MTGKERLAILHGFAKDTDKLHLPMEKVREIDSYLEKDWGIRLLEVHGRVSKVKAPPVDYRATEVLQFIESLLRNLERNFTIPATLEMGIYDVIAQDRLHGSWFSRRRAFILDTAAILTALIGELKIRGPVLDLGCNAGFLAIWLAKLRGLQVTGLDFSEKSIALARTRSAALGNVEFRVHNYVEEPIGSKYKLIVCCSGFPDDRRWEAVLENIASSLMDGGVFVLVGLIDVDWQHDGFRKLAKKHRLGFGLVDQVGGAAEAVCTYSHRDLLILVKGVDHALPEKMISGEPSWQAFRCYTDTFGVPWEEKTIAYFRAKKSAKGVSSSQMKRSPSKRKRGS